MLAWAFDAPLEAAGLVAASSPVLIVALHRALRVLDHPVDEATRRSTELALALLLLPVVVLVVIAIRMGEAAIGRVLP